MSIESLPCIIYKIEELFISEAITRCLQDFRNQFPGVLQETGFFSRCSKYGKFQRRNEDFTELQIMDILNKPKSKMGWLADLFLQMDFYWDLASSGQVAYVLNLKHGC